MSEGGAVPFHFPIFYPPSVAEQSAPAVKADILQGLPSVLKYSKDVANPNVESLTRTANANASAKKQSRATSKLSRRRFGLAAEEKEYLQPISPD